MADVPEDLYRAFTTTVGLITTRDERGSNVMAAEWTWNVSYEPMLVMIVLEEGEATFEAVRATREFGVNLCAEDQALLATLAGHFTKRETDKLSSELFETYPASVIKAPLIRGCLANAECRLVSEFPVGDHVAFVGEVVAATWDPAKKPLVLHRGYRQTSERIATEDAVSATATPMRAPQGTTVDLSGEFRSPGERAGRPVRVEILAPDGARAAAIDGETGARGYYDLTWTVPEDAAEGTYTVVAKVGGVEGRARLVVQ